MKDIDERFWNQDFDEVFCRIEELVREYPNYESLILSLSCMVGPVPKSELFAHLNFKKSDMSFMNKIQENLLEQFRSDESYEFIRNHPEWADFRKKWYS